MKNLKRYIGPSGSHKRTIPNLIVEDGGPNKFVSRLFLHAASYVPENSARAFLFGFCCVALAALIKAGALLFGATLVFATFYPAALLSALVGGLAAGIVAILLSAVVGWLAFMPPELSSPGRDWSNLVFFAANAMLIVWLSASYRGLLLKVLHHEREREFLLNESQHRSKNLLPVVIVSRSLQAQPSTAEIVLGRLKSLSIADQLLFATEARRVGLRELLNAQLEMYGSQISLVGQAVELDAPQARTIALISHELATNAAKYGCFSKDDGTLVVSWSVSGEELTIKWTEIGVSQVAEPHVKGFGLTMIEQLVSGHHGQFRSSYQSGGVVHEIKLRLGPADETDHVALSKQISSEGTVLL